MFLHPLVLARWAEVQGNDCGSGIVSQIGSKMPEPTVLFQSQIHLKISVVATAKIVKQATTACISWVGGMVSISLTTYVLWLWVRRKKAQ